MTALGNRLYFGLDYKITEFKNPVMGYCKVWFGGSFMCTEEDLVYIDSYIFNGLKRIFHAKRADLEIKDKQSLFNCFYNRLSDLEDDEIHKYLVNFGTASDDFTIFAFEDEIGKIHLVWRLHNTDTPFQDLNKSDTEIHYFSIDKEEYAVLVRQMRDEISGSVKPEFL